MSSLMIKAILTGLLGLGVTIGGYFLIQRLQDIGRQDLQIERLEQDLQKRGRIDDAIRNTPTGRDGAVGVLNDFLNTRD